MSLHSTSLAFHQLIHALKLTHARTQTHTHTHSLTPALNSYWTRTELVLVVLVLGTPWHSHLLFLPSKISKNRKCETTASAEEVAAFLLTSPVT